MWGDNRCGRNCSQNTSVLSDPILTTAHNCVGPLSQVESPSGASQVHTHVHRLAWHGTGAMVWENSSCELEGRSPAQGAPQAQVEHQSKGGSSLPGDCRDVPTAGALVPGQDLGLEEPAEADTRDTVPSQVRMQGSGDTGLWCQNIKQL